jgi:hypothetical protein
MKIFTILKEAEGRYEFCKSLIILENQGKSGGGEEAGLILAYPAS